MLTAPTVTAPERRCPSPVKFTLPGRVGNSRSKFLGRAACSATDVPTTGCSTTTFSRKGRSATDVPTNWSQRERRSNRLRAANLCATSQRTVDRGCCLSQRKVQEDLKRQERWPVPSRRNSTWSTRGHLATQLDPVRTAWSVCRVLERRSRCDLFVGAHDRTATRPPPEIRCANF